MRVRAGPRRMGRMTVDAAQPFRVVFVCTGNICRSPMAEVVLRHVAARTTLPGPNGVAPTTLGGRIEISSAGTGPWHEGEPMDPRARVALAARGYRTAGHVARQFASEQFKTVDLVVALDRRHQQTLRGLNRGRSEADRLVLLRSFDREAGGALDVPDPYYGDETDFDRCLSQVEAACHGLTTALATAFTVSA